MEKVSTWKVRGVRSWAVVDIYIQAVSRAEALDFARHNHGFWIVFNAYVVG